MLGRLRPVETINTRDGNTVDVNRGDIQLIIFYRPGDTIMGQIMFAGGYPFCTRFCRDSAGRDATYEFFTKAISPGCPRLKTMRAWWPQ